MYSKLKTAGLILVILLLATGGVLAIDISGDGLRVYEDLYHGSNPFLTDTSGDGLTDYEEIHIYGTDPTTTDTTGDGLSDYEQIHNYGTNPLVNDTTGDELSDYDEIFVYGTDPTTTDTTRDGLSDYDEIFVYGTDPTTTDTTGDGLSDYEQIHNYGTNPLVNDTTGDGLSDYDEIFVYGTDPTTRDTTGDGLYDYYQIHIYGTDPLTNDTLGNGLLDYDEIFVYGTDPLKHDTLGNGLTDYQEIVVYGTDPLKNDTLKNGISDFDAVMLYGLDPLSDPELGNTKELKELFELDNNVYNNQPINSIDVRNFGQDSSGDGFSDSFSDSNEFITTDEMDVFVQVSYMAETDVSISALLNVQQAFANAPVSNTDGEEAGINLHFYIDSEPVEKQDTINLNEYSSSYYREAFTSKGYGFYHVLITHEVTFENRVAGGAAWSTLDGVLVGGTWKDQFVGHTLMHELGHTMGLWPWKYVGIDGRLPIETYPSVMNYNVGQECWNNIEWCFVFSDGPGFDDWDYIERGLTNEAPDMRNL